ncbi:MAG: shikimate dehydrogenase [Crocosphaera sp.]
MNEPIIVTYDLAEVLKELKQDIKEVNQKLEKLNTIEVKLATLNEKVEGIDKRLERVENSQDIVVKEVSDLKGFRSLILPIIVGGISAIIGGIVTVVARLAFFTPNP